MADTEEEEAAEVGPAWYAGPDWLNGQSRSIELNVAGPAWHGPRARCHTWVSILAHGPAQHNPIS